jgi:hypothetical protein
MKKLKFGIVFFVSACLMVQAQVSILEGYGKTSWGQSVEDVKALVPDLESNSRRGSYSIHVSSAGVPDQTKYVFGYNQLSSAVAVFKLPGAHPSGADTDGADMLREMIAEKYGSEEVATALKEAGITINVKAYDDGRVEVSYTNQTAFRKATEAAGKARQEALAAPRKTPEARRKDITAAGIDDAL